MSHPATPIGRPLSALLVSLGFAALILLAPPPGDAGAVSPVGRELRSADRALSGSVRSLRAGREAEVRSLIYRVYRHTTRAERTILLSASRSGAGRRVSATRERRVLWLRSLIGQQARNSERLALELPRAGEQARRYVAVEIGHATRGWVRAALRMQLEARGLGEGASRWVERQLKIFLWVRYRRATALLSLLDAQAGDAAGRYVLRQLGLAERSARGGLTRLGVDVPAPGSGDSAEQQSSDPSPQAQPAPSDTYSEPIAIPEPGTLVSDRFGSALGPNNLITNHYAYLHHTDPTLPRSPNWEVTSGTVFHQDGTGWTGTPTACAADQYSQECTGSAIFRMRSKRTDLGDVEVSARLRVNGQPAIEGRSQNNNDGISIWPRYQSQYHLYIVNVQRRDGTVVFSKKCPGGTQNNGTYHRLDATEGQPIQTGAWRDVSVSVTTGAGGEQATVSVKIDGADVVSATDTGVGCDVITGSGRVGIRGDNTDFSVDDVLVRPL